MLTETLYCATFYYTCVLLDCFQRTLVAILCVNTAFGS